MVKLKRCLDTYALVEVARGNKKFVDYMNEEFVLNDITLSEFYAVLLREYNEKTAEYWYKRLERSSKVVNRYILKESMKFRYENKKSGISFFDAVGYIFSIMEGYIFVTGDKAFEKFRNVEFKKK